MFKIGMSLVFAFIAAMVIILAGLISDARLMTVLLRSVVGFLATGVVVWLLAVILEHQNIIGFDKNLEPIDPDRAEDPKSPEAYEEEDEAAGEKPVDMAASAVPAEAAGESEAGFTPLSQDNLTRMEPPVGS